MELQEALGDWRYGDAPYVFGYAAVKKQVALVVLQRAAPESRRAVVCVLKQYDLRSLPQRLDLTLALQSISTVPTRDRVDTTLW